MASQKPRLTGGTKKKTATAKVAGPKKTATAAGGTKKKTSKASASTTATAAAPSDLSKSPVLQAVLDDPDDDAARLVLADWLLERGDPRGEFIQIQCALGARLLGARGARSILLRETPREALVVRERELLKKYQAVWLAPIRAFVRTWNWRRGFVEGVVADGKKFVEGAATIFANTPLEEATLTALKPAIVEALAREPLVARLRSLDVSQQRIGPDELRVFASPSFASLRSLDLWGNPLGEAGAIRLASASLDRLERLELATCKLTARGVEALSRAAFFPRLRRLGLAYNDGLGPPVAEALTRGASLESIDLGRAGIGDEGLETLARSPNMKNLTELALFGNGIGPRGIDALVSSANFPKLTTVTGVVGYAGGVVAHSDAAQALRQRFGEGVR